LYTSVLRKQRFDLAPQRIITIASLLQKGSALAWITLACSMVELLNLW
jgi:hypothetical protein